MRVCVRVDASARIGLGHFKRCLSLAAALESTGAEVQFVARALGTDLSPWFVGSPFGLYALPAPSTALPDDTPFYAAWSGVAQDQDARETAEIATAFGADWVIVDHYAFDAGWHRAVRTATGARIAAIDDLANRPLDPDLLIDHNLADDHRVKYASVVVPNVPLLAGPRHALLDPIYAVARRHQPRAAVERIGVFMGGTDPDGLSERVLRACREHAGFLGELEVVTTRANPRRDSLAAACEQTSARLTQDLPDLAAFFARHDLQIGAGGGAMWERCCIGAPTLAVQCADNQSAVLVPLERTGAVRVADGRTAEALGAAIAAVIADHGARRALAEAARILVDGRGAQRVALWLNAPAMSLRPATFDDAALLHGWRNDPRTRSVSLDTAEIPFDRHCAWLDRVLADPRRLLRIAQVGRVPVGSIRFDLDTEHRRAEVSLYLDPALHGLGLGRRLLAQGDGALPTKITDIDAVVLPGNTPSRRMFLSAGYATNGETRFHRARHPDAVAPPQHPRK